MLVPNGALRFEPETEEQVGGVNLGGDDFGLEREEVRATIGRGSRQTVHILQDDGTLEPVEVVTGLSDGRRTVVTSDKLKAGMKVVTSVSAAALWRVSRSSRSKGSPRPSARERVRSRP